MVTIPPDGVRQERFGAAMRAMVERVGEEMQLWTEIAPGFCGDGHPVGLNVDALRVRLVEEVGVDSWDEPLNLDSTLELVTALFRLASAPTEGWDHRFCGSWHPTSYSQRQGRYDFTVAVNNVFERFGEPLRMRSGRVENLEPEEVAPLIALPLANLDRRIQELVDDARRHYHSTEFADRVDAVHSLVQAWERAKSLLGDGDKRAGVRRIAALVVPDPDHPDDLNQILTGAASIGNDVFRHEEVDRPNVRDDLDVDFWFFLYLILLRAADRTAALDQE